MKKIDLGMRGLGSIDEAPFWERVGAFRIMIGDRVTFASMWAALAAWPPLIGFIWFLEDSLPVIPFAAGTLSWAAVFLLNGNGEDLLSAPKFLAWPKRLTNDAERVSALSVLMGAGFMLFLLSEAYGFIFFGMEKLSGLIALVSLIQLFLTVVFVSDFARGMNMRHEMIKACGYRGLKVAYLIVSERSDPLFHSDLPKNIKWPEWFVLSRSSLVAELLNKGWLGSASRFLERSHELKSNEIDELLKMYLLKGLRNKSDSIKFVLSIAKDMGEEPRDVFRRALTGLAKRHFLDSTMREVARDIITLNQEAEIGLNGGDIPKKFMEESPELMAFALARDCGEGEGKRERRRL